MSCKYWLARRCRFVVAVGVGLFLWGGAGTGYTASQKLVYDDLSKLVQAHSLAVRASKTTGRAEERRRGHLGRTFLPRLDVTGGVEHYRSGPFPAATEPYGGAEVSVNLYRGGRDQLQAEVLQTRVNLMKAERKRVFREELAQVRLLFWELVGEHERMSLLNVMLQHSNEGRKAAEQRAVRGLTTKTDALVFTIYSRELEQDILMGESRINRMQKQLGARLGMKLDVALEVPSLVPYQPEEPLNQEQADAEVHPDFLILLSQAELHTTRSKLSSRWWTPSLGIYGSSLLYTSPDRFYPAVADRWDFTGGIRIRFNAFDGFRARRESQYEADLASAYRTRAGHTALLFRAEVETLQQTLVFQGRLIEDAEPLRESGKQLLVKTRQEYDRGIRDAQDVLAAIGQLRSVRERHLALRQDNQSTRARLAALLGE